MSVDTQTDFSELFLESDNQIGLCLVMLLAWLASCDGQISREEEEALEHIAEAGDNIDELKLAIDHARRGYIDDLQLACEVARHIGKEQNRLFMQMAIGIAVADGYLYASENYILRFFADLMEVSPSEFEDLYREITGHAPPSPGDPSSAKYWEEKDQSSRTENRQRDWGWDNEQSESQSENQDFWDDLKTMTRARALAILGLESGANEDDIRSAYRRLARIHHPDRYASLGPEAVETATITFRRINTSYEYLVN